MAQVKYVAAGFSTDAALLLSDFIQTKSLDFSVFAEIWKVKNFSLVYMGRSSESELTEFTQEIFSLSARYLTTETSLNARVGAVYLLYALFRNQILEPPLRIRMVREQFEVMAGIRKGLDGPKCLRYVIDYLCEYGTDWVACPALTGPMVPVSRVKPVRKIAELGPAAMAGLKTNLVDLADSRVLQNLSDLSAEYLEAKTRLVVAIDSGFTADACKRLEEFATRLRDVVEDTPDVGWGRRPRSCKRIGVRRMRLKQKAMGQLSDQDSDGPYVPPVHHRTKRRVSRIGKVKKPGAKSGEPLSKAEVLGKFNKRKKPKNFRYDGKYWAPPNDAEAVSKDAAEMSYWYKKDEVVDADSSESEDVDSPKPVVSSDEVKPVVEDLE